jgi:hypothetical protein
MKPSLARVRVLAINGIPIPVKDVLSLRRIERREALEITAHRPYGGLPDLVRTPLFPRPNERLTASLPVHPCSPSALRLVRRSLQGNTAVEISRERRTAVVKSRYVRAGGTYPSEAA